MITSDVRNYEVSIWTLQDSFITVLKYATLENKGQIQDPVLDLIDDGTQNFSFKIPMYITVEGQRIQNPIWYNTVNGTIMANMRKVKVIVNKKDAVREEVSQQTAIQDEEVFEFIITKVTEQHQTDTLYCQVECEGLAFHELGKIGYKISLTSDEFYDEDIEWFNNPDEENRGQQPRATLQYWNDVIFKDDNGKWKYHWEYQIQMDWSGYTVGDKARDLNKVYEDSYVSSWKYDEETGAMLPRQVEISKQKQRLVDLKQSNIYNLTQGLAQTFGVHCKYEYQHDGNYHIIGKKVIYYNNFLNETFGALDLTYPFNTSSITREMDGVDQVTKMFVKPVTSDTSADGFISILTTPANKSGEDYLLNFDYLYTIGAITQQQYDQIHKYESKVGYLNSKMVPLQAEIVNLQQQQVDNNAKVTIYKNAIALDGERITASTKLLNAVTNDTGILRVDALKPTTGVLLQDSNTDDTSDYYLKITQIGIKPETLRIFRTYNYTATGNDRLTNEIFGVLQYDEYNNLIRVNKLYPEDASRRTVYLTYDYTPQLYYENIKKTWEKREILDKENYRRACERQTQIAESLAELRQQYNGYLEQKNAEVHAFEVMMGPALREGYWMPDDYDDYGDKFTSGFSNGFDFGTLITEQVDNVQVPVLDINGNKTYSYTYTDIHGHATPIWDRVPFDEQQLCYYESGVQQEKRYYPCIRLTQQQLEFIQSHENASLIFYDLSMNQTMSNIRTYTIGSECKLGLLSQKITNGSNQQEEIVFPVLYVTGADTLTQNQLKIMQGVAKTANYTTSSDSISEQHYYKEDTIKIKENEIEKNQVTTMDRVTKLNAKGTKIGVTTVVTVTKTWIQSNVSHTDVVVTTTEQDQSGNQTIVVNDNGAITTTVKKRITEYYTPSGSTEKVKKVTDIRQTTQPTETAGLYQVTKNSLIDGVARPEVKNKKIITITNIDRTESGVKTTGTKVVTKITDNSNISTIIEQHEEINEVGKTVSGNVLVREYRKDYQGNQITIEYGNDNLVTTTTQKVGQAAVVQEATVTTVVAPSEIDDDGNEVNKKTITKIIDNTDSNGNGQYTTIIITEIEVSKVQNAQVGARENSLAKRTTTETKTINKSNSVNTCARIGTVTRQYNENVLNPQVITTESSDSVRIVPKYNVVVNNNTLQVSYTNYSEANTTCGWIDLNDNYQDIFPRIKINSLALKDSSNQFSFIYHDNTLTKYVDYSIFPRVDSYFISPKIDVLLQAEKYILEEGQSISISSTAPSIEIIQDISNNKHTSLVVPGNASKPGMKLYYCLSNADTSIYLDAIQVLKESAYPKVSYEIDVNIMNPNFVKTLYNKMGYIVHINDNDLKFENVLGYISEIHMHLARPWQDEITVKNYKTKFQDLFTKIVASTEQMRKNSYTIGLAAQALTSTGDISSSTLSSSFSKVDLDYAFNNGKLTINQRDGIWGTSDSGVVAFRGGGIFTSTQKDADGNWIWNTGITPEGINADLITTGQLDTSKIKVYSGDRLRFQLNGDGLFAYKSFVEDFDVVSTEAPAAMEDLQEYLNSQTNGYTKAQYVKFTENGLFLVAQDGAHVYDKNIHNYRTLQNTNGVTRVEVSWSGFKLRNWSNEEVFYADPDTGNLILQKITAKSGKIGGFTITDTYLATGGKTAFEDLALDGVYFSEDGISLGKGVFSVAKNGHIYSTAGSIGGWTIQNNMLYSAPLNNLGVEDWEAGIVLNASGSGTNIQQVYSIWAGSENPEGGTKQETYYIVDTNGHPKYGQGALRGTDGNYLYQVVSDENGMQVQHSVVLTNDIVTSVNGIAVDDNDPWGKSSGTADYFRYYPIADTDPQEYYVYKTDQNYHILYQSRTVDSVTTNVALVFKTLIGNTQLTKTVTITNAKAPFRLKRNGELYVKKLYATQVYSACLKQGDVVDYVSIGNISNNLNDLSQYIKAEARRLQNSITSMANRLRGQLNSAVSRLEGEIGNLTTRVATIQNWSFGASGSDGKISITLKGVTYGPFDLAGAVKVASATYSAGGTNGYPSIQVTLDHGNTNKATINLSGQEIQVQSASISVSVTTYGEFNTVVYVKDDNSADGYTQYTGEQLYIKGGTATQNYNYLTVTGVSAGTYFIVNGCSLST